MHTSPNLPDDRAWLADRAAEIIADWPPLTEPQIENIVAILQTGTPDGVDHELAGRRWAATASGTAHRKRD